MYFPSWFYIKRHKFLTDGSRNYYHMLHLIMKFPHQHIKEIALENLQYNRYWAHPECILVCMLADDDTAVRNEAVDRIMAIRAETVISGSREESSQ